jgi:hypothetical protein
VPLFWATSAKAELSPEIKDLAIECGKTDAAFLDAIHETANAAAATQMFKTSATLFGCTTVSDARGFI